MKKFNSLKIIIIAFMCSSYSIILAQPTITSFTPLSAKPGDVVTINGTGFNTTPANNIVFFGATKATVTSATATQLAVTVPIGAIFGPLTLQNVATQLICNSISNFNPIYSPAKTGITTSDFSAAVNFLTGRNGIASALADFDGDGKTDLLVNNFNIQLGETNRKISVYRNTSTAGVINASTFIAQDSLIASTQPYNIAVGDVNGDGKLDLVVPNFGANTVSVFRNTSVVGTISFAAKIDLVTATQPRYATVGDIDGDGQLDIIVTNYGSNSVSVFLNNSTISSVNFAAKTDFTAGTAPSGVSCNDIDGNGKPDVIITNYNANTISVLRNTSTVNSLSFATKVDFASSNTPNYISVADVDGDSKLDIAVSNYGPDQTVSVFRNTSTVGAITLSAKVDYNVGDRVFGVSFGDLDGDGKPDLLGACPSSNKVSILLNNATSGSITTSSFAPVVDITGFASPATVSIGDIDGDGRPDLVVPNNASIGGGPSTVSVLRNTGALLPITLDNFNVLKKENTAVLQWTSKAEVNAFNYEVERSLVGNKFEKVGEVIAKGTASDYQFTDILTANYTLPTTIYYRLKLVDKDGKYSYSEVRQLSFINNPSSIKIYPNPVSNGKLNVDFGEEIKAKTNYIITTVEGRVVQQGFINNQQETISIQNLGKGMYIIKLASKQKQFVVL